MQIIEKEVETLIEYKNNPRKNERAVEAVANSIEDFGFKIPIVIDENNIIIAGHTRLLAAKKLGLKKVPCIVASDLTEEQIKAFRLIDNRVAEIANWNEERLEKEFGLGIEKLERYGFNEHQLESYNREIDIDEFFVDDEDKNKPKQVQCPHCKSWFEK